MRINDGSICGDCSHFEHDCDYDCCFEYCNNEDEDVKENFYENDDVREYLIIEADNSFEADNKMNYITKDYSEYCSCCGERWEEKWDDEKGNEEPMIYETPVDEVIEEIFRHSCIIYYKNGEKRIVEFKKAIK